MSEWAPLVGVAVLAGAFALRINPMAAVILGGLAAGFGGGVAPLKLLAAFGHAFNQDRSVSLAWLVLPVIGLLEGQGLQERARARIAALKGLTVGRLLATYLVLRQFTAALGLTALGGQAQMIRPLIAPMAEATLGETARDEPGLASEARAHAAAVDNIGAFFGEDVFIAFGSVLLIQGVLKGLGAQVEPFRLSAWAAPTAVAALVVHGARLLRLDRRMRRRPRETATPAAESDAG